MRVVALIAALACAAPAAQARDSARESRYGPAPDRAPTPVSAQASGFTGTPYSGAFLGWSGKREATAPDAAQQTVQQPWWARQGQAPAAQPVAPAPPRVQQASAPTPRALPRSLYDITPTPPTYPSAPAQPAYAAPEAQPSRQVALQSGQLTARTYSVGRQFGMQPDPIPAAGPSRMVLIADPGGATKGASEDGSRDDRDWPAKSEKDGAQ
jgi:hypothetical protein